MVGTKKTPRKSSGKKRAATKSNNPEVAALPEPPAASGLVDQMRTLAGTILDIGAATVGASDTLKKATVVAKALRAGQPMRAASEVLKAVLPDSQPQSSVWKEVGAALRTLREAAGLTIQEIGTAINLKDPALIEALENGKIALPFEIILRLAAVLGRNDPVGFIMKFTRTSNPDLWNALEALGFGKLLVQSAREREFANIYRSDDDARRLNDVEFAEVLSFVQASFTMAMAFRGRENMNGAELSDR